jgi:membrane protein required for beta-lactamase induction
MPHDNLADDLNRSAGSGGEGGSVPSKVMGAEMDADQAACFTNHNPGGVAADRKKPLFRPCTVVIFIFAFIVYFAPLVWLGLVGFFAASLLDYSLLIWVYRTSRFGYYTDYSKEKI